MPPNPPSNPFEELLQKIFVQGNPPEHPDTETTQPQEYSEERHRQKLLNRELELKLEQKEKYAGHIFTLISAYLIAVLILVVSAGAEDNGFFLSNSVLITILTTTTTTVIGLFLVFVRHLFPPDQRK